MNGIKRSLTKILKLHNNAKVSANENSRAHKRQRKRDKVGQKKIYRKVK